MGLFKLSLFSAETTLAEVPVKQNTPPDSSQPLPDASVACRGHFSSEPLV